MERTLNGSWGELFVSPLEDADRENLLLFDDDDKNATFKAEDGLIDYQTGLPYSDRGWLPKKIFIANRSDRQFASFTYTFNSSIKLSPKVIMIGFIASIVSFISVS